MCPFSAGTERGQDETEQKGANEYKWLPVVLTCQPACLLWFCGPLHCAVENFHISHSTITV